jgi:hypothetical protein
MCMTYISYLFYLFVHLRSNVLLKMWFISLVGLALPDRTEVVVSCIITL